ncbi:hypothetical protein ACU6U9_03270 [Pseudomonas sp. HK3]
MAAIPYKIYLLFSALIPAFIYSVIAAVLVGLLTLRVNENDVLAIALFFTALCFTASFRMIKDLWSIWPYAIYSNKFKIDEKDKKSFEDKPTYKGFLEKPFRVSFFLSILSSGLVFAISYFLVPYAFSVHLSILWLIGAFVFPLTLFSILLITADVFYRSYSSEEANCESLTMKGYVKTFYLYPEALCFLLLNFAIISPLNSVQSASLDVAWVTMLVTISITTLLLLLSAHSNPMSYVIGGLNSKLIKMTDLSDDGFHLNKTDIKDSYKVKKFSLIGWWLLIVVVQVVIATLFMSLYKDWFYAFLFTAQIVWMVSYIYLRNHMLINSIKQVVQYHGREDLQQGYMDLSKQKEVPA